MSSEVYRWEYNTGTGYWVERREISGDTEFYEYRGPAQPQWQPVAYFGKETFQEMVVRQTGKDWVLVNPNRWSAPMVGLVPEVKEKQKCKCEWRDVYMKGCVCGGI